ncbi:hypothetical protein LCGC14_2746740 [marine sediment metagenome]|uniref:Thioredoxin domain-containing protein n=1 Tax=marine sediment metagenome TaxID=412755 RepID=A0A0F9BBQ6_9ZZZZ
MSRHMSRRSAWTVGMLMVALGGAAALWALAGDSKIVADVAATGPAATVSAPGGGADAQAEEGAKVIAVKFHADWCGYCKAMGNVFEEMQAKFDTQPVLYVTLDQTREFNRRQSKFLANALGLADIWSEHGSKTGFILLIDGKARSIIAKLTHDQDLKTMGAALTDAVNKASGSKKAAAGSGRSEGSRRKQAKAISRK